MKRDKQQMQQEALSRAASGIVVTNYAAIFEGFAAKGIPESEISRGRTSSPSRRGRH
jgi:hypothetical protein